MRRVRLRAAVVVALGPLLLFQEYADAAGDRVRVLGVISKDGVPRASSGRSTR